MKYIVKKTMDGKVYVCEGSIRIGPGFVHMWALCQGGKPFVYELASFGEDWGVGDANTLDDANHHLSSYVAGQIGADRLWAEALS